MSKHVNGRKKVREKSPLLTKAQLSDFHKGRTDKPVFKTYPFLYSLQNTGPNSNIA